MIPGFEFRFLICTYLPGIPLSLALYFLALPTLKCWIPQETTPYLIPYIIISPTIIGLVIDGIRHRIDLKCRFFKEITRAEMTGTRGYDHQVFLSHILSRSITFFYLYEFFSNFAISLFLSIFVMPAIHFANRGEIIWWQLLAVALAIPLFLYFSHVFIKEQERLREEYFK